MEALEFKNLLEKSKQRYALETKQIKRMALYNYLNDNIPTTVIDCRRLDLENISLIRDSYHSKNFPFNNIKFKSGIRLILVLEEDHDLKISEELESLRTYIKNEDMIEKGIFEIKNNDFQKFISEFKCFLVNNKSDELTINLARTSFPLMVLDNFLYVGNFMNSKNIYQLKVLNFGSIISLLKTEDSDLKKLFNNYNFFEVDEEKHSEIDFNEIIELIESEKQNQKGPVLIYCFSGQSVSLAVCIAYLTKYKKWSLEFSTAYMMKIFPNLKIQAWLYTQLLRTNFKSKESNVILV
jgi:hypothetical protein